MATTTTSLPINVDENAVNVFILIMKVKTSDLPLSSAQRSTIDSLLHTIKKKGDYDALRKKVWSEYADSVSLFAGI